MSRPTAARTRIARIAVGLGPALVLALGLGLAVVVPTSPAAAATSHTADPADASASNNDIRSVFVDHRSHRVRVKVRFTDLRLFREGEQGIGGLSVWLDTRPRTAGPDFRIGAGLADGTDTGMNRTRGWRDRPRMFSCIVHTRVDFEADVFRASLDRGCLGDPRRVRVAVKMRDDYDPSHPVVDWVGARRSFTPWLGVG